MMTSAADTPSSEWMSVGMPRPSSVTVHRTVGVERHRDLCRMAGERLVDCVVDDLIDHVVQSGAVVRIADIHARPLANGIEPAQNFNRVCAIGIVFGTGRILRVLGHRIWAGGRGLRHTV